MWMVITLTALGAAARTARSQVTSAQVAASAGSATDERGVRSDAVTLAPSVAFAAGRDADVVLSASATRFVNTTWQVGLGAALDARTPPVGRLVFAIDGGGGATQASFNATFAQADAVPSLRWTAGALTLIGGAHVATGYAAVNAPAPAPLIPPSAPLIPPTAPLVSESRASIAPSYGGEFRFGAGAPVSALLSFREEPTRVGGMLVTDQIAGTTISAGALTVSAVAGHRSAPDEKVGFASGTASLPLGGAFALTLAGGTYPSNRLTGAVGGRFFSSGISISFGGAHVLTPPIPAGVRKPLHDATRFAIRAPDATRVDLAGDWNAWTPVPATRASNGVWYVDLPLQAGEYRYAFRIDGSTWKVPDGVVAVDDGFGGKSAYVTIRTADSASAQHNQEDP